MLCLINVVVSILHKLGDNALNVLPYVARLRQGCAIADSERNVQTGGDGLRDESLSCRRDQDQGSYQLTIAQTVTKFTNTA